MTGSTAATEPGAPAPGSAVARVLVVDDEPAIADLVATTLRYEGFETRIAGDGRTAPLPVAGHGVDLRLLRPAQHRNEQDEGHDRRHECEQGQRPVDLHTDESCERRLIADRAQPESLAGWVPPQALHPGDGV